MGREVRGDPEGWLGVRPGAVPARDRGGTVAAIAVETTCPRHPNRIAGRHCTRCGRPACPECLVQASVGSQCIDCVRAGAPSRLEQVRRQAAIVPTLVTNALIALNVAVYAYTAEQARSLVATGPGHVRLGLFGPYVADGEWWRLVTAGFVHFGPFHLAMNMWALLQVGRALEPELGRARFALLYVASLLAGSAGALVVSPNVLTAGASGAIFGLFAALAVLSHRRGVNVLRSGIGTLIIVNLLITFTIPGISIGGHVGGLIGGAAAGWALDRRVQRAAGVAMAAAVAAIAVAISLATVAS